ncbi:hypothetical protein WICMUC_005681 [Wickerhamomyces mucosus]|uniref:tRNA dimethylallyltransferase n=1 Tax=Wickerhamomyces mucosus TaxID=1378264 RepID=A0A9P8P5X5_9ASCO|nr:hypothetical protein WICMUC_005681 [Wickerhamomyces mucosus]
MQMYKGVPIITNKHPIEEREGVPHYVMNHIGWDEKYFIHRFRKEALAKINEIHSRKKTPIIIGGTHYYLNSLIFNNKTIETNENKQNSDSNIEVEGKGQLSKDMVDILNGPPEIIYQTLLSKDPKIAGKFHPNDTRRVRRALEIIFLTNKKTSEHYSEQLESVTNESSLNFNTLAFWVYSEKSILDKRLDDRVDKMLDNGGMDEIKELYYYYSSLPERPDCERGIWQVIGFKEFLPWLESGLSDDKLLKQSIIDMKTRTRQYAKRQIKWIKSLLAVDLLKESKHGYTNGGKLYLLDATDLKNWDDNVFQRGALITNDFLQNKACTIDQTPDTLRNMLPKEENTRDNEDKSTEWKHIKCEVCFNNDNSPLILIGDNQYKIHLNSKRHRSNLNRGKRKRDYEAWLAKNESK